METLHTIDDLRALLGEKRQQGLRIGFVPTMGNLHEGHLSLIDSARRHSDFVVSSIFVNPMQFGENEDLDAYPRTLQADSEGLKARGCNALFAPSVNEVYPNGLAEETRIHVPQVSAHFCGASRPGHFEGVATVVSKLFNMVQPDVAVFGQKDFQQLAVIRKMVRDLCFPIEIIGEPTSREASGLARSSRNGYLSESEKQQAAQIYTCLKHIGDELRNGSKDISGLEQRLQKDLSQAGFRIDYAQIANGDTLEPAKNDDDYLVVLVAVWLGSTRLIDNIEIDLRSA